MYKKTSSAYEDGYTEKYTSLRGLQHGVGTLFDPGRSSASPGSSYGHLGHKHPGGPAHMAGYLQNIREKGISR